MEKGKTVRVIHPGEKRAGSSKAEKTKNLRIHKEEIIEAEGVEENWIFKGYRDYVVQNIVIEPCNIKYRMKYYLNSGMEIRMCQTAGSIVR